MARKGPCVTSQVTPSRALDAGVGGALGLAGEFFSTQLQATNSKQLAAA